MIGRMVGQYRITDLLGDGGLGPVYRAVDASGGSPAAVRVFAPEVSREAALMDRLRRIVPVLQGLRHPNVGAIYDMVDVGGSLGMLLEYVPGSTVDQIRRKAGAMTVNVAVSCAVQALRGIEQAHALGVFHHSLRPSNLIATQGGIVKVVDFGTGHAFGANRKTREDRLLTVLAYLAPEQIRNQAGDARSDIYALGVVLFELVTGRLPFDHRTEFALMQGHLNEPPMAPRTLVPSVPAWLDGAIVRALAKDPEQRFQTAAEMRGVLEAGLGLSTTGSAAVVRGAAGQETVAMFTEAPPIPAGAPAESALGTTLAMPGLDGAASPSAPHETVAMPGADSSVSAPAPKETVAMPGADRVAAVASSRSLADDETIVLPLSVPASGAGSLPPDVGGRAPLPELPASARGAEASPPAASAAGQPAASPVPAPRDGAGAGQPPKPASKGRTSATSRPGASRLGLAAIAVIAVLVVVVAGAWWMSRPSPATGDTAASTESGLLAEPPAEMSDAAPREPASGSSLPATEMSTSELQPPVSTVPPPPEPESAPPPPAPKPRPKAAPPKPVIAPPPGSAKPASVATRSAEPPASPPPSKVVVPRPALPDLSFQKVKLVTEQDGKAREIDVLLMFLAERMAIAPARGGAIFKSVPYEGVAGAGYEKASKRRVFFKTSQHMFTIDSSDGPVVLRLDNENVEPVLQAFEARTGKTVARED